MGKNRSRRDQNLRLHIAYLAARMIGDHHRAVVDPQQLHLVRRAPHRPLGEQLRPAVERRLDALAVGVAGAQPERRMRRMPRQRPQPRRHLAPRPRVRARRGQPTRLHQARRHGGTRLAQPPLIARRRRPVHRLLRHRQQHRNLLRHQVAGGDEGGERTSKLPKLSFGGRIGEFYQNVKLEMRKTTWPTRTEVWSTTVVVLIAVFFFGFYLWGVDRLITLGFEALEQAIK